MKASLARTLYVVAFLVVASYALVTLRGPHGVAALIDKQHQINDLEKRNASLAQEVERTREHIKRLQENPSEQELEIRQRLKRLRPDEKVYIIGDPQKR